MLLFCQRDIGRPIIIMAKSRLITQLYNYLINDRKSVCVIIPLIDSVYGKLATVHYLRPVQDINARNTAQHGAGVRRCDV